MDSTPDFITPNSQERVRNSVNMSSILFKNVDILARTKKSTFKTIVDGFLGIKDDKILYIGKTKPTEKYDVEKDYSGKLLMPGLVNAHGHAAMTLLRGVGSGKKLQDWLFGTIIPIENKMVPYDVYVGAKLAALEMISSGTTCVSEMYDFPYATALAFAEVGIRSNLTRTGLCSDSKCDISKWPRFIQMTDYVLAMDGKCQKDPEIEKQLGKSKIPQILNESIKKGLICGDLSIHAEYTTTPNFIDGIVNWNKDKNYAIQIHVSETKREHDECISRYKMTPTQYFYSRGLLDGGNCYFAHCVHVDDNDLDIMSKTRTSMITNPSSNMKLASGFAPVRKALDKGVNVGLGTDGCASNNNLDMFEEMHLLAMIQSGISNDPSILQPSEILEIATVGSANAMHRKNIGELKVGYKADIIAIDLDKPHLFPNNDTVSLLVYSAHGSDVCMTMIDGNILYENGNFTNIDYGLIKKEVDKVVKKLL